MADELAVARAKRPERPDGARKTEKESRERTEGRPPLWHWFSQQIAHSNPVRAEAAKHVRDRFNLAFIRFSAIDRALAKEDSDFLIGFRELLDEYRIIYDIAESDEAFARETGVATKMLPFAPEICVKCKREAVPGTGMCARHGGQWISEKDISDMSRQLKERLLVMSFSALRTLQDLMDNAKSEQVRSQTAALILDRAGLGAHVNVNHSGSVAIESSDEAMEAIQARLDTLAINIQKRQELEASSTGVDGLGDVIDAEVVEA